MELLSVFKCFVRKVREVPHRPFSFIVHHVLGCDINAQDDLGQTAAHYSVMHNHVEALKYLVNKRHVNLSISSKDSKLPIHYAAKHGSKNVLSFFFQTNLTIYASDQHGNTIAHEASESNQLECLKLIWKLNRTLLAKKNHLGRTPNHTV